MTKCLNNLKRHVYVAKGTVQNDNVKTNLAQRAFNPKRTFFLVSSTPHQLFIHIELNLIHNH